jgi:hydrogenase nickel incorporation protein HypB
VDLLPYVPFDPELAKRNARTVHPGMEIVEVSCQTGDGMKQWLDWIDARLAAVKSGKFATV